MLTDLIFGEASCAGGRLDSARQMQYIAFMAMPYAFALPLLGAALLFSAAAPVSAKPLKVHARKPHAAKAAAKPVETIGSGTVDRRASGPPPAYGIGGPNMVLVKNWHFGTQGTIKNIVDMSANFVYHDQFGTYNNGFGNYGANTVALDKADALPHQPIEGVDSPPVRRFTADSLKTFLTPLDGAATVAHGR